MYKSKSDLPETLRKYLPEELQEIYLKAYQESWENYEEREGGELDREGVAHRDGMTAVQQDYVHNDETGEWHRKGEEPEDVEEQTDKGPLEEIKDKLDNM